MSERQPRKSGLSPSPIPLALILVITTVVVLGVIYFFRIGMSVSTTTMTGSPSNDDPKKQLAMQNVSATATAAEIAPTPSPTIVENPTRRPPPTLPPPPTEYVPGPTAQFTTPVSIEEWQTLVNPEAGFTLKYPSDWYVVTPEPDHEGFGSGATFYSYDPKDLFPVPKGSTPSPNISKVEITLDSFVGEGGPLLPTETLAEWVRRTRPMPKDSIIREYEISLGDNVGFAREVIWMGRTSIEMYVPRGANILLIGYPLPDADSYNDKVIQQMFKSFSFLK